MVRRMRSVSDVKYPIVSDRRYCSASNSDRPPIDLGETWAKILEGISPCLSDLVGVALVGGFLRVAISVCISSSISCGSSVMIALAI